jgi:hypothetical protein
MAIQISEPTANAIPPFDRADESLTKALEEWLAEAKLRYTLGGD